MSSKCLQITIGELVSRGEALIQTGPFGSQLHSYDYVDTGIPVIPTEAIGRGQILDITLPQVTEEKALELSRHKLKVGDILFARRGAQATGLSAIVDESHDGSLCGTGALLLRLMSSHVDARFVAKYLSSQESYEWLRTHAVGAVMPNLNTAIIKAFPLIIPPLSEQLKIANFLDNIDSRISLLGETNTTLDSIAQALFKSWFVDFDPVHANAGTQAPSLPPEIQSLFPSTFVESPLGLVPEGWGVCSLGDITERITKGTTPTTLKKPFVASGINFVKIESITENGDLIPEKFAFIDEETHQLLKRSQLKVGDVLVTIAGTIGRISEVTADIIPANTNQAVALIRPIPEFLPTGLVKRFLQRTDSKQRMGERIVQAVQANLSLGSLSSLQVVLPPKEVVSTLYDSGFFAIDMCKQENSRKIRSLSNLRDTLLPRLISGQLRLPEVEEHIQEIA